MLHILLVPALILLMIVLHLFMVVVHKHTQYPGPGRNDGNVVGYPSARFTRQRQAASSSSSSVLWPSWRPSSRSTRSGTTARTTPRPCPPVPSRLVHRFVDGALRLMPGVIGDFHFEYVIFGYTLTLNVLLRPWCPAGILFTVMFMYPWIERWITKDNREHHVLDRPRNAPPAPRSAWPASSGTASCGRLPVRTSSPRTSTCR